MTTEREAMLLAIRIMSDKIKELEQENTDARREAEYLAMSLWRKYYQADSPECELCDTTAGIISQIDRLRDKHAAELWALQYPPSECRQADEQAAKPVDKMLSNKIVTDYTLCEYITAGKEYDVISWDEHMATIIDDDGDETEVSTVVKDRSELLTTVLLKYTQTMKNVTTLRQGGITL